MTVDIAWKVNKALAVTRVPTHIRIQRLFDNEKRNLSGLIVTAATGSRIISQHCKLLFRVARRFYPKIVDVTGDQR